MKTFVTAALALLMTFAALGAASALPARAVNLPTGMHVVPCPGNPRIMLACLAR